MSKLIDAEPILKKLFRLADRSTDIKNPYEKVKISAYRRAYEEVLYSPRVEAEPVRHGHWEWNGHCGDYECSCCHRGQDNQSNYCSNCGARMDEQEESK